IKVSFARSVDDLGRQVRWRSLTVPSPGSPLAVEIVTQRLLVEARLPTSGCVTLRRPEPRAVGSQHLVDQEDAAVCSDPELELGIRDDNAALRRSGLTVGVDCAGSPLQLASDLGAENPAHVCNRDVLVVSSLDLGGGTEQR